MTEGRILLVFGGRDFNDRDWLYGTLDAASQYGGFKGIICGYDPDDKRYQGADQLAYEWARDNDFPCRNFPAPWKEKGRAAGPIRNSQMAEAEPDEGLAWPRANGEWGNGTLDMMRKLAKRGIPVTQMTRETQ